MRPRVLQASVRGSLPVLLEELVAERLAGGARGRLVIIGPPGSGRTTALRHLAQCLGPRNDLVLSDDDVPGDESTRTLEALIVCTGGSARPPADVWQMAPWSDDDLIEYLMARHRYASSAVFARCP